MQCARIDYEILAVDLSVWREPLVLLLAILRFFARSIMRVSLHVRLLARFSLVRFSLVRFVVVRLSLVRKSKQAYHLPSPTVSAVQQLTHNNRSPPNSTHSAAVSGTTTGGTSALQAGHRISETACSGSEGLPRHGSAAPTGCNLGHR